MKKEKDEKFYYYFRLLTIIVGVVGLINSVILIFIDHEILSIIINVFSSLALVSALSYILLGAKKENVNFYRIFMIMFSLFELTSAIIGSFSLSSAKDRMPYAFSIGVLAICFIVYLFLSIAKDLRKQSTFFCGYTAFALIFVLFLASLKIAKTVPSSFIIFRSLSNLALSFISLYLISAKYKDKEKRRTE